jgi:hypothetical protein
MSDLRKGLSLSDPADTKKWAANLLDGSGMVQHEPVARIEALY